MADTDFVTEVQLTALLNAIAAHQDWEEISQSAWNALSPPDPDTLYLITS